MRVRIAAGFLVLASSPLRLLFIASSTTSSARLAGTDGFYNGGMVRISSVCALLILAASPLPGQTPQPFPRPGGTQPQATRPSPPQAPPPVVQTPPAAAAPAVVDPNAPTAATLGFPVYPSAEFLASYDAGHGQRYYIFGSTAPFADLVTYYRAQLKERGDQVFEQPLTHMFQIGRFREETMAFPPGVTVKDWTWGGSQGYVNPKPGAQPARFPTVVMIVPVPVATAAAPAGR